MYERVPILGFWNVLLVPIQGELSDSLAATLCEDVLQRIHASSIRALIIDLTGAWMIDSHLCATLSRLATSASLMGTRTVFSGMSPEAALTLQTMGIDMPDVDSAQTLEAALELVGVKSEAETIGPEEDWLEPDEPEWIEDFDS